MNTSTDTRINVSVNGKPGQWPKNTLLVDCITEYVEGSNPFAIALNGDFLPRSRYQEITLNDGDEIDIVNPVGGG